MHVTIDSEAQVMAYGEFGSDGSGKRIAYGDGAAVEYVDVLVVGEESTRRIKLDRSINGSRPEVGTIVQLKCEALRKADVAYRQDGSAYSVQRDKWTVLDLVPAKAKA